MNAKISQIEYYLPAHCVTNEDLSKEHLDWDFKSIEPKTGITSRYIASQNETASDLAAQAADKLFANNPYSKQSIDTLIYCTQSPDFILPTTACILQDKLQLPTNIKAFDVNLGCSGYIYGLALAKSLIMAGISETVLLICAETYSKYISKDDRTARTLFGDAAAATIIETFDDDQYIGPFVFGTDGSGKDKIIVRSTEEEKTSTSPITSTKQSLYLDGPGVFMFTMHRVPECVQDLLTKTKRTIHDVDLFVFHQASKVVIDNILRILSLPEHKVFRGYETIGNTVSASIPIALKQASLQNRCERGHLIMLVGFGVGLSWGACFIKW